MTDRPDTVLRLAKTRLSVELTSEKLRNGLPGQKQKYQYQVGIDDQTGLFRVQTKAAMGRDTLEEVIANVGGDYAAVLTELKEQHEMSERTARRLFKQGEDEGWLQREGPKTARRLVLNA